ncbi:MAG: hypothetical protein EA385_13040, partial [Salinarimonadaceae bacterium]
EEEARRVAEEAERIRAQEEFQRVMEAEREAIRRLLDGTAPDDSRTGQPPPRDAPPGPLMILPPGFAPN